MSRKDSNIILSRHLKLVFYIGKRSEDEVLAKAIYRSCEKLQI